MWSFVTRSTPAQTITLRILVQIRVVYCIERICVLEHYILPLPMRQHDSAPVHKTRSILRKNLNDLNGALTLNRTVLTF